MVTAGKVDLYKLHKDEYVTPRQPVLVDTKPAQYLSIAGEGDPGSEAFVNSLQALYSAAFTIKMTRKFAGKGDYGVCKLEGLWWAEGAEFFSAPRQAWKWKLLIRTPDFVGNADLTSAVDSLLAKGKPDRVRTVRLDTIREGLCVQILHVGPYSDEPATIDRMKAFAAAHHLALHGLHHEIYLSDPRRVAPEKLRTILRQPVK